MTYKIQHSYKPLPVLLSVLQMMCVLFTTDIFIVMQFKTDFQNKQIK